ncbi:MAG: HAD hydrolase-like protein, partial [Parvibaculum sp.]
MAFSFSPSLVIFDCDGVLVDTEPVANRLLARVLSEEGFQISYEECRRLFVGRTMDAVRAHVEAALGRALRADWTTSIRDRTLEAFTARIEPVAGAGD